MTAEPKQKRWYIAPYFFVEDVVATANFYRDKLGFGYDRFWGEPPCFCMVGRQGITIMLSQVGKELVRPNNKARQDDDGSWDAYIWVEDAQALHDEFAAKGVTIARGLCKQEYGCLDFDILDINGYRLCFGQDLEN